MRLYPDRVLLQVDIDIEVKLEDGATETLGAGAEVTMGISTRQPKSAEFLWYQNALHWGEAADYVYKFVVPKMVSGLSASSTEYSTCWPPLTMCTAL